MKKRFSIRTLFTCVGVLCALLAFAVQERERRRLDAKCRYAVWRLEDSQRQIAAMNDAHDDWHSATIQKFGGTVEPDRLGEVFLDFKAETERMNMYLSDAWLLTGWDDRDEEMSVNGPPR